MSGAWPYLVGPWSYGSFIIGYFVLLTFILISAACYVRWRQNAWWRRVRNVPVDDLCAMRSRSGLWPFQEIAIQWLIDFREREPYANPPEMPPEALYRSSKRPQNQ